MILKMNGMIHRRAASNTPSQVALKGNGVGNDGPRRLRQYLERQNLPRQQDCQQQDKKFLCFNFHSNNPYDLKVDLKVLEP